ncbi:hypothetical protein NC652_040474 [Populus alba x Populus x berolinensis]|nr:hypothetical protein NC652_040474 [Populus alba x Populus x berolinensis]
MTGIESGPQHGKERPAGKMEEMVMEDVCLPCYCWNAELALCGGFWTRTELGFGTGPRIMVSRPFEILDTRRKLDLVFVALQLTLRSDPTIEYSL